MGRSDSTKIPPDFPESKSYIQWQKELKLWQLITGVEKKKQGPLIILSSFNDNPRAKRAVESLKIEEVNNDDGVKAITDRLTQVFVGEQYENLFHKWTEVRDFKRNETHKSMVDYILEFESKYAALSEIDNTIQFCDIGQAMNLLNGANITEDERKMVLAHQKGTGDTPFTFKSIANSLKTIFDSSSMIHSGATSISSTSSGTFTDIKQEAFYTNNSSNKSYNRHNNYTNNSKSQNYSRNSFKKRIKYGTSNNRIDVKTGKPSLCGICKSEKHWARACPHRDDLNVVMLLIDDEFIDEPCNLQDEGCNITYYQDNTEEVLFTTGNFSEIDDVEEYEILLCEVSKSAVLDTGCSKTVCGEQWFNNFAELVPNPSLITYKPSQKSFIFGDGRKIKSLKVARLPVNVEGHEFIIETEVVPGKLPLLLSKEAMQRGKMIINFANNTATLFGRQVTLHGTSENGKGHYCLQILPMNLEDTINCKDSLTSNTTLPTILNTIDNDNLGVTKSR